MAYALKVLCVEHDAVCRFACWWLRARISVNSSLFKQYSFLYLAWYPHRCGRCVTRNLAYRDLHTCVALAVLRLTSCRRFHGAHSWVQDDFCVVPSYFSLRCKCSPAGGVAFSEVHAGADIQYPNIWRWKVLPRSTISSSSCSWSVFPLVSSYFLFHTVCRFC